MRACAAAVAVVAALLPLASLGAIPARAETRCGWLENPTPGNWWLKDRAAEWELGVQGGRQADGMDAMPDMSTSGEVLTNGNHGYSCACITGSFDHVTRDVLRVTRAEPRPLRQCRADRRLPRSGG